MQRHHIQRAIIHKLVRAESALYSQLKPDYIDGNTFTYHLKQLQTEKLIQKQSDGTYSLTSKGKIIGTTNDLVTNEAVQQSHSVILMGAYDDLTGSWLLRKRLAHPMYGRFGFVHSEPRHDETITTTARRTFAELTGYDAEFSVAGSGYIRLHKNGELESFICFTFLLAKTFSGSLLSNTRSGENMWVSDSDIAHLPLIPSTPTIFHALTRTDGAFFIDESYEV